MTSSFLYTPVPPLGKRVVLRVLEKLWFDAVGAYHFHDWSLIDDHTFDELSKELWDRRTELSAYICAATGLSWPVSSDLDVESHTTNTGYFGSAMALKARTGTERILYNYLEAVTAIEFEDTIRDKWACRLTAVYQNLRFRDTGQEFDTDLVLP